MLLVNKKNLTILAGDIKASPSVDFIFNKNIIEFFDTFSNKILSNQKAKNYPDLISLGFWIRKKNLELIKKKYFDEKLRIGVGLTFHITPSNVALNFAYSFILSVLCGNSNIVRVSNVKFDQKTIFFEILKKLMNKKKFLSIKKNNIFISYNYEEDDSVTRQLCNICDCRVIWGSDKTIQKIKRYDTKPNCKDLIFSDKYSVSILNLESKIFKVKSKIFDYAQKFYVDSLMFEQNACTSPHLIFWYGKNKTKNYELFWKNLNLIIQKGKLFNPDKKNTIDRYSKLCEFAATRNEILTVKREESIFRTVLKKIPKDIHNFRVGYGYYFEYFLQDINEINKYLSSKIQTLTYAGFDLGDIKKLMLKLKPHGIDRIVPFGRASEFNEIWDGYDLPRYFSKIIDIK